ncbi:MAG: cob(I)yrinic acid a,c-diamide adenosyltransferase [Actinomycetia bacterium]|nr:cob(I)yrinic acid a,c-diamide adenosyltransferase [Actinomycetes bacterium]
MPIYTRSGDQGLTGLLGGSRVAKTSARVEAYGAVDEASAAIGAAKACCADPPTRAALDAVQRRLSTVAAQLAADGSVAVAGPIGAGDVAGLERLTDAAMAEVGPRTGFVVPGDDPESAALHQARAVVRRAERRILAAGDCGPSADGGAGGGADGPGVPAEVVVYVNRLSDALYALALAAGQRRALAQIEELVRAAVRRALDSPNVWKGTTMGGTDGGPVGGLTLASAKAMAEAAEAKGGELGVPIVFAAVDAGGNLILAHRMADSLLASIDIAINKAFTAAALRQPTAALRDQAGPDGELYGIETSNAGRIVVFGGGLPVFADGALAGGIGVSGGTVAEDMAIVEAASRAARAS